MKKSAIIEEEVQSSYDVDFFEWTQQIADDIRRGKLSSSEFEHVAEEIEDMGKRDRRELQSRLIVLMQHLLKWSLQPERRDGSTWRDTIDEQRTEIELVLKQSPSLKRVIGQDLGPLYRKAAIKALRETRKEIELPPDCPFDVTQILDPEWLPE